MECNKNEICATIIVQKCMQRDFFAGYVLSPHNRTHVITVHMSVFVCAVQWVDHSFSTAERYHDRVLPVKLVAKLFSFKTRRDSRTQSTSLGSLRNLEQRDLQYTFNFFIIFISSSQALTRCIGDTVGGHNYIVISIFIYVHIICPCPNIYIRPPVYACACL